MIMQKITGQKITVPKPLILLAAILSVLAVPSVALAQFAAGSGQDIELYADDIVSAKGVTTLTGQADIRQGDTRLLADKVKIYSKQSSGAAASAASDIDRVEAIGNFYYITSDQEVKGSQGVYEAATDMFTVTGDVILLQGESIVTGTKLVYEVGTQKARVTSNCQGRKCGTEGRVSVLIKNAGK
jgi:lipopolysaccharide export system protein LptA